MVCDTNLREEARHNSLKRRPTYILPSLPFLDMLLANFMGEPRPPALPPRMGIVIT